MSLYRFFESYIEETPELLLLNHEKPLSFDNLQSYFKVKQTKSTVQSYLDILLHDSLCNNSKNLQEYEILRLKTRRFAEATQKLYESSANH